MHLYALCLNLFITYEVVVPRNWDKKGTFLFSMFSEACTRFSKVENTREDVGINVITSTRHSAPTEICDIKLMFRFGNAGKEFQVLLTRRYQTRSGEEGFKVPQKVMERISTSKHFDFN